MTQEQINKLAMNLLLDTQESKRGLIWTTDWSKGEDGIDSLNEQGQLMLASITQRITDIINQ